MAKQINEEEQIIVATMVAGYMDRFKELAPLMALSPTKGAHLFNLALVSFVVTAAVHLDETHKKLKNDDGYTKLNMYGKEFDTHLELFKELLHRGKVKHTGDL